MKTYINTALSKIHPILWQLFRLALSITAFSLILINRSPNILRPTSMALRTGFGLVIPTTALVIYLAYRIPGRLGDLLGMILTTSLFAMPLAGLWASGQTQSIVINGLIPLSDASNYYIDSLRLMVGRDISRFSAMRPFFTSFLSLALYITNRNLMFSLAIITAVAAFAVYFSVREFQKTHGPEVAVFILILLFLYYRWHSGTSMSETLGTSIGTLGVGLLWRSVHNASRTLAIFGLFILSFALNIRPGTMFILPLLLIWLSWVLRTENELISFKALLGGAVAIIFSFYLNSLYINLLAEPSGMAFSNFSWALYGLASGGNSYGYIFSIHPELYGLHDPEQSQTIYRMAIDLILSNPSLIIKGSIHHWGAFFSDSWYNAYSFISGSNDLLNSLTRRSIYILGIIGIFKWTQKPRDPFNSFIMISTLGVLLSVPFVPPTDSNRVRLYAATIVIFALLPALGIQLVVDLLKAGKLSRSISYSTRDNQIIVYSIFLTITILASPFIASTNDSAIPKEATTSCPEKSEPIIIHLDKGTFINTHRESVYMLDWMPNFHQGLFRRGIHGLADNNLIDYLENLESPISLLSTLDYLSNQGMLLIIPTDQLPMTNSYTTMCGNWETVPELVKYNIFKVEH